MEYIIEGKLKIYGKRRYIKVKIYIDDEVIKDTITSISDPLIEEFDFDRKHIKKMLFDEEPPIFYPTTIKDATKTKQENISLDMMESHFY